MTTKKTTKKPRVTKNQTQARRAVRKIAVMTQREGRGDQSKKRSLAVNPGLTREMTH